jgi:hypothetical protein
MVVCKSEGPCTKTARKLEHQRRILDHFWVFAVTRSVFARTCSLLVCLRPGFSFSGNACFATSLSGRRAPRGVRGMRWTEKREKSRPCAGRSRMTEAQSDRTIATLAGETTVLTDHTKSGHIATMRQAKITAVHRSITDPKASAYLVEAIREQGAEVWHRHAGRLSAPRGPRDAHSCLRQLARRRARRGRRKRPPAPVSAPEQGRARRRPRGPP